MKYNIYHKVITENLVENVFKMDTLEIVTEMDKLIAEAPLKKIAKTVSKMRDALINTETATDELGILLNLKTYYESLWQINRFEKKFK